MSELQVLDTTMAYAEIGTGRPIVFLHGNPTSSYLWRNVMPHVADYGRCLAPDLIGMGRSGKMPGGGYRFVDHVRYLDQWFEQIGATENVVIFCHDWGAALGFHRIARFPDQVVGLAYMEAMVRPGKWADLPAERVPVFKRFRTDEGARRVLEGNLFVEKLLFEQGIIRALSDEEKQEYRAPYPDEESRLPTLVWPQEIPFDGEPADTHELVDQYSRHLTTSEIPKLFVNTTQGHALIGANREFCRTWKNQTEVTVAGRHYAQEDAPDEIGRAFAGFLDRLES
jgi:haloalkane dehalogenase